ncbi:hypothetical protein LCGC14_0896090 [marine sediment metagenome]|uniref:Deacetylase sirtuin-type domain-containing protein n=1 Tax=marine sediment metagenome TaxID=412755 RepID=A0A0F9PIN2_9ZZZZ|nr:hypothetical protein [Candidatus Aminicenantes bacterium]
MAENVFIFGAGASKDAGVPLMNKFIEEGLALKNKKISPTEKIDFDRVDQAITSLNNSLYSKINIELINIEDVFGLIEMGRLLNKLPGYENAEKIEELRKSIIKFIVVTIEQKNLFVHKEGKIASAAKTYAEFAGKFLRNMYRNNISFSAITFNYDISLDHSLSFYGIPYNYCLPHSKNKIKLIKLHGSINWGICSKCKQIMPIDFTKFFTKFRPSLQPGLSPDQIPIRIGSKIGNFFHSGGCRAKLKDIPLLIPPTWNKTDYHHYIKVVWKQAAIELSEAENIFIIGYSMPETDLFFKYLLGLGTINPIKRLRKFWVFNPDRELEKRYKNIKGLGIEDFQFFSSTFKEAIEGIPLEYLAKS